MVWARRMGTGHQEGTPLVYDGVMYLPGPGDVIQAIDAKTGDVRGSTSASCPRASTGDTNRNLAICGNTDHRARLRQSHLRGGRRRPGSSPGTRRSWTPQAARASAGPIIADGLAITGR